MVVYLKSREDVTMSDEDTGNEEGYYVCEAEQYKDTGREKPKGECVSVCVLVIIYGIRQRWRTQVRKRLSFSSSFLCPIPWLSHGLAQTASLSSFLLFTITISP